MDRLIYIAMNGAKHALSKQASTSHNLANVSTDGFRSQYNSARAAAVIGPGQPTRTFVVDSTVGTNFAPGPIDHTGRGLDVAVEGRGWIAVQTPDGREAYTRSGALEINANGQLQTKTGLNVVGDGGPITIPPNAQVLIGGDGTVTARVGNGQPQGVGRLKLVSPEAPLLRGNDGLFRAAEGDDLPADATAALQTEALEGSNVSPVESMVAMISAARQFEQQMKMLQTAQEREQSASKLLSGS